jgi:hypothetical protein
MSAKTIKHEGRKLHQGKSIEELLARCPSNLSALTCTPWHRP